MYKIQHATFIIILLSLPLISAEQKSFLGNVSQDSQMQWEFFKFYIEKKNSEISKILLIILEENSEKDCSILHLAVARKDPIAVKLILENFPFNLVDSVDKDGNTAFVYAVYLGCKDIVTLLLSHNHGHRANPFTKCHHIKNNWHRPFTAIHLASQNPTILEVILSIVTETHKNTPFFLRSNASILEDVQYYVQEKKEVLHKPIEEQRTINATLDKAATHEKLSLSENLLKKYYDYWESIDYQVPIFSPSETEYYP